MTKDEKETIINFNEGEHNVNIYSCTKKIWNKCEKLGLKPIDIRKKDDEIISKTFECPKTWIKILKPRVLSEENKNILRGRFLSLKNKKAQ